MSKKKAIELYQQKKYIKAFDTFQECPEHDPEIKGYLSKLHINLYGEGTPEDYEKAYELAQQAAENHDPCGLEVLGHIYYYGLGDISYDFATAKKYYEQAIEHGNNEACAMIAEMYRLGIGEVSVDYTKAFEYYFKQNPLDSFSIHTLISMHKEHNISHEKYDESKLISILKERETQEEPEALATLGLMYQEGLVLKQDKNKAMDYFLHSSRKDGPEGMFFLVMALIEQDEGNYMYSHVKGRINKFCRNKDRSALSAKGFYHALPISEEEFDLNIATECLKLAEEKGELMARNFLAFIYLENETDPENIQKGVALHEKAARYGSGLSSLELSSLYIKGKIVTKDIKKAMYYADLAIKRGLPSGANTLGDIYYYGLDGTRDLQKALDYYTIAAEANDAYAQQCVKWLSKNWYRKFDNLLYKLNLIHI